MGPSAALPSKATVVGLAREGTSLARFLARRGVAVLATDLRPASELAAPLSDLEDLGVELVLGGHPPRVLDTETLYVSPGVPTDAPLVEEARRRGLRVTNQTQLFLELCPAPVVAITGSCGKSTTTALAGEMLRTARYRTWVGGNIGRPLIEEVEDMTPEDRVVMELSSFQLELVASSPHVGAVLNIAPDHLDRHPSLEAYVRAKGGIFRHQAPDDWAVGNADDPHAWRLTSESPGRPVPFSRKRRVEGAYLEEGALFWRGERVLEAAALPLPGPHNVENALCALAAAACGGAGPEAAAEALASFHGLEHVLEAVADEGGVLWVNDSAGSSPARSAAALCTFDRPIMLIAGGRSKKLPWEEWAVLVRRKVRHLLLVGEAAGEIREAVGAGGPPISEAGGLEEAVEAARRLARPGDIVLLSPACTSFDQFQDFAARGRAFKALLVAAPSTLPSPKPT